MHDYLCNPFYKCNVFNPLSIERFFSFQLECKYLFILLEIFLIFVVHNKWLRTIIIISLILTLLPFKFWKSRFWRLSNIFQYLIRFFQKYDISLLERWIKLPIEVRIRSLTPSLYTIYLYYITPQGNYIYTAEISARKSYFSQSDKELYSSLAALIAIFDYSSRNTIGYLLRFFPEFLFLFLSSFPPSRLAIAIYFILCISKLWLMQRIVYRLFYLYSLIAGQDEVQDINAHPYLENILENLARVARDPLTASKLLSNLLAWKIIFPMFGG